MALCASCLAALTWSSAACRTCMCHLFLSQVFDEPQVSVHYVHGLHAPTCWTSDHHPVFCALYPISNVPCALIPISGDPANALERSQVTSEEAPLEGSTGRLDTDLVHTRGAHNHERCVQTKLIAGILSH